jgi:hypothetical protein
MINNDGAVDEVLYSDKHQLFPGRLVDFDQMTTKLKHNSIDFKPYKNTTFIQLFVFKRKNVQTIKNGDELIEAWEEINRTTKKINSSNKQIFLAPKLI